MQIWHTLIVTLGIVAVVAILFFGVSSCSERSAALKQACINAGGSVISQGEGSFHCITNGRNLRDVQ